MVKRNEINIGGDSSYNVKTEDLWGFCDGRSVYINSKRLPQGQLEKTDVTSRSWARIHNAGPLCLVYYIQAYGTQAYFPYESVRNVKEKPIEFILDSRNGLFCKADLTNLQRLISRDAELLAEFNAEASYSETKLYRFIRKFNTRNPLH